MILARFYWGNNNNSAEDCDTETAAVFGTPLAKNELSEFEFDRGWADSVIANTDEEEFLDSLGMPEIKELYLDALSLVHIMSTENLARADGTRCFGNDDTYISLYNGEKFSNRYEETGYTYDSFYNAFLSVFTKETADNMLSRYPSFYEHDGALWYAGVTFCGNISEVHREYELTSKTDNEVSFRFVKTEDGWRAAEFLNAEETDKSRILLIF